MIIKLAEIIIVNTSVKTLPDIGKGEPRRDHFVLVLVVNLDLELVRQA